MLIDLSWIADGKPWPPEDADEAARLAEHARMRAVYNGLHETIFPNYVTYLADAAKDPKKQAIILDWPELATSSYLNLLIGEEPEVLAGTRTDLPERPDEAVFLDRSRYGIGLYEVSDAGIQALNPENCYLVVTPGNIQIPQAFVFFDKFKVDKDEYVKLTIHTKSQIQHLIFAISNGILSGPKDLEAFPAYASLDIDSEGIQKPAVDDILIVAVQNQLSSERYYGRSDYKPGILSLVSSLELLFAQRAEVLAKFTSPTPVIPESASIYDRALGEWVYKPGQAIITQPGDVSPSLMVWDAQLVNVDRAIEQSMDQLLQMLELSRVLLAGKDAGTAESGTALRIRLIPTLSKVGKAARQAEKAIPKVIHLWSQLHPPEIPIAEITVNLQDGIPEDPMETAQVAQFWDAMGAISLERKLELQGLKEGSEAFDKELTRLKAQPTAPEEPGAAPKLTLPALEDVNGQTAAQ